MATKQTYAARAKSIMKRYEPRLGPKFDKGDKLSLEAMNDELTVLQQEQEQARVAKQKADQLFQQGAVETFAMGGKLTKRQRSSVTELLQSQNQPQGQFKRGGKLPMYGGGGYFDRFATTPQLDDIQMNTNFGQDTGNLNTGEGYIDTSLDTSAIGDRFLGTGEEIPPYKSRVPYFGAAAQGLGSILANRKIDFGDDKYTAHEVAPNRVDYSREREQAKRDRDIAQSMIRRQGAQTGSQAQSMNSIITGATGTQRNLGRQLSQSFQGEENQNAQIENQAGQFNAQQRSIAERLNLRTDRENLLINEGRRSNKIQGVSDSIVGYGKDMVAANQYDSMLELMAPENYQIGRADPKVTWLQKALQLSDRPERYFNRTDDQLYKP